MNKVNQRNLSLGHAVYQTQLDIVPGLAKLSKTEYYHHIQSLDMSRANTRLSPESMCGRFLEALLRLFGLKSDNFLSVRWPRNLDGKCARQDVENIINQYKKAFAMLSMTIAEDIDKDMMQAVNTFGDKCLQAVSNLGEQYKKQSTIFTPQFQKFSTVQFRLPEIGIAVTFKSGDYGFDVVIRETRTAPISQKHHRVVEQQKISLTNEKGTSSEASKLSDRVAEDIFMIKKDLKSIKDLVANNPEEIDLEETILNEPVQVNEPMRVNKFVQVNETMKVTCATETIEQKIELVTAVFETQTESENIVTEITLSEQERIELQSWRREFCGLKEKDLSAERVEVAIQTDNFDFSGIELEDGTTLLAEDIEEILIEREQNLKIIAELQDKNKKIQEKYNHRKAEYNKAAQLFNQAQAQLTDVNKKYQPIKKQVEDLKQEHIRFATELEILDMKFVEPSTEEEITPNKELMLKKEEDISTAIGSTSEISRFQDIGLSNQKFLKPSGGSTYFSTSSPKESHKRNKGHASDDESHEHDEPEIIKMPHNLFKACMV